MYLTPEVSWRKNPNVNGVFICVSYVVYEVQQAQLEEGLPNIPSTMENQTSVGQAQQSCT